MTEAIRLKPDVIILDFALPELNGLDVLQQIHLVQPSTGILVYTMHNSEQLARKMADAGACGFVLKSDPAKVLLAALHAVSQHKPFLSPSISKPSPFNPDADRGDTFGAMLTPREREIVQLIAEGHVSKEIADLL